MPITKIPITHKFGIISQSQREELQERLIKQVTSSLGFTTHSHQATRNPLELTDEFIQKFNSATTLDDKEPLEGVAFKLLARAKRRAGLTDGGQGNHVDLPKAWSELSMLAQCRGKIQEECLDTLIVSLHQAPLSRTHIPCLFYLGETTLYWLRTDAMNQPFLRIGEIKLLKMGYTVFERLFYHHMVGHLHGHSEFKERLATYLSAVIEGFADSEEAYGPYPGAHLCLKYIISVGKMIAGEVLLNTGKVESSQTHAIDSNFIPSSQKLRTESVGTPSSPPNSAIHLHDPPTITPNAQMVTLDKNPAPLASYQSSIHDLSPSLWHALDVWRCSDHLAEGFKDAVAALSLCASRISNEHWVDAACAIKVVGEAALGNISVLKALQNLAKGKLPAPKVIPIPIETTQFIDQEEDNLLRPDQGNSRLSPESLDSMEIKFEELLGIREFRIESGVDARTAKKLSDVSNQSTRKGFSRESHIKSNRNTSMCVMLDSPQVVHVDSLPSAGNKTTPDTGSPVSLPDISSRESQLDSASGFVSWGHHVPRGMQGGDEDSDLAPGDDSLVSSRQQDVTKQNIQVTTEEVIVNEENIQRDNLASSPDKLKREVSFELTTPGDSKRKSSLRATTGQEDGVQKSSSAKSVVIDPVPSTAFYVEPSDGMSEKSERNGALHVNKVPDRRGITTWPWEVAYIYTEVMTNICLYGRTSEIKKIALIGDRSSSNPGKPPDKGKMSMGLLDLAELEADNKDGQCWRVRYAAISGLVKISRCFQGDSTMDGMRTVVWNSLMVKHSKEVDEQVLEAFRVGQVEAQVECEMQKVSMKYSLNFRIAAGLASNYLPPLPPPVAPVKRTPRQKVELPKPQVPANKGPNRPSLRDELKLASALPKQQISFCSRNDLDLRRIVEDQWRKELHEQLEEEERERQKQLKEEQKRLQEEQKERDARKAEKFKKKKKDEI